MIPDAPRRLSPVILPLVFLREKMGKFLCKTSLYSSTIKRLLEGKKV
jgi:hypothetical protein